jgi:hypothetical protein
MSAHVDPIVWAASSGRERSAMLAHLRACSSCQRSVAAHDPSALFGLLALAPLPPALLDDLSAAVARQAGNDRPSYVVLADPAVWPRRAAAAAVLVLTLLSGYATLFERSEVTPPLSLSSRRADVEVESSRGVSQVIDLTVGETQIVMVYNGDLNL